jgi:hypothetical protein
MDDSTALKAGITSVEERHQILNGLIGLAGWQHLLRFWVVLFLGLPAYTRGFIKTFETEQVHLWILAAPTSSLGGTAFGNPGQRICMRFPIQFSLPGLPSLCPRAWVHQFIDKTTHIFRHMQTEG